MSEQTSPYGGATDAAKPARIRTPHLMQMKANGQKWAMLTAYGMYSAAIFEEAGIQQRLWL